MTTDNFTNKKDGRTRINNALLGLGLLLAAFLILNTLNNDLLNLDVELRTATVTGELGQFNELLNAQNLDIFLEQQDELVAELLAAGAKEAGCALTDGNVLSRNSIDTENGRSDAVRILRKQQSECGTELVDARSDNKNTSYTSCVAVREGNLVKTCYFRYDRSVPNQTCANCSNADTFGISDNGNFCQTTATDPNCYLSEDLRTPIQQTLDSGIGIIGTEGHPATRKHSAQCHYNGTCMDFVVRPLTSQNIYQTIETWENSGGQAVYEVTTQEDKDAIIAGMRDLTDEQKDLVNKRICVFTKITGPHFSGYSQPGVQRDCSS